MSRCAERACAALALIGELFWIERAIADAPARERALTRAGESRPVVDRVFAWCAEQAPTALDDTPWPGQSATP